MFAGDLIDPNNLGSITLRTDSDNHPGMIFYELDDGMPEGKRNKILEFLEKAIPIGVPFEVFRTAPSVIPTLAY